jgi:hypothetical protein
VTLGNPYPYPGACDAAAGRFWIHKSIARNALLNGLSFIAALDAAKALLPTATVKLQQQKS